MKRLQEQSSTGNFESVKQQSIGQRSISLGHQITQRRETDFDHKINEINGETVTLFLAWGRYKWWAYSQLYDKAEDGLFRRDINGVTKWCKKEHGVWFIGHPDKTEAENETRHSIHQQITPLRENK